jgi:type VI secretion system protein ImpG
MDRRLLDHYNLELQHLRETGGEFAREFPKVAQRLGLDAASCNDPYVERLLEGFAFLAARIQLKIDAEFPRFTQQLFEAVYPQFLCPTPAMAMVRLEPDLSEGALAAGPLVPRGSILRSFLGKDDKTRCTYATAHDVRLWPLEVETVVYHARDLATLGLSGVRDAQAAVRVRLRTTAGLKFNELDLDDIELHLTGDERTAMLLYEQLFAHALGVVAHDAAQPPQWQRRLPADAVRQWGFDDEQALLPYGSRSFHGYRLLHEYFVFPQRFMFVQIAGLAPSVAACEADTLDLTVLLDRPEPRLENALSARSLTLSCTPAMNLFEKRLDRVHLSDRFSEFHLVPDRTAPLDFEVHSVLGVTGIGARGAAERQAFEPFYAARDADAREQGAYFSVRRMPRTLSQGERQGRRRSMKYAGSEVYVSLVDSHAAPYHSDLKQLDVTALCTNRDLPIHMPVGQGVSDFELEGGAPVSAVRCLDASRPLASPAEGEFSWKLISHLTLNYLTIANTHGGDSATALRELLMLYTDDTRPELVRQIGGVKSVRSSPIVRRISGDGPAAFARGLEVEVLLEETGFEGSGVFLLGAALERFFAKYVTLNSFTETLIRSDQRGEVKRWRARTGQRPNL